MNRYFMNFRTKTTAPIYYRLYYSDTFTLHSEKRNRFIKKPKRTVLPEHEKFWAIFVNLEHKAYRFKMRLLDELIRESKVNFSHVPQHVFSKILVVNSSISSLVEKNMVKDRNSVITALLSILEPFPFDGRKMLVAKQSTNENDLTITKIRNIIEKEYLAWKYKVSVEDVEQIFKRYSYCFYDFRSLGNLHRNVKMLDRVLGRNKICLAEKIYHINQKPFEIQFVTNFEKTVAGLHWEVLPLYCPKLLFYSHQQILFRMSALKAWNFSDQQIQEGLPFLYPLFNKLMDKLNFLISDPEIGKHRSDVKFLSLLCYPMKVIKGLVHLQRIGYTELVEGVSAHSKQKVPRLTGLTATSALHHASNYFQISKDCKIMLKRHPKYGQVSVTEICETLAFLKSLEFKDKELEESITIILYPKNLIDRVLEKIKLDAETLEKYGFKNGCVPDETNFFKRGTKEKQKILQLCLYYLEKPHHFSGEGIWGEKDFTELNNATE